jgi:hypothetical protein
MAKRVDDSSWLMRIDRRFVYLFVLVALALPLVFRGLTTKPAPLPSARQLFDKIERIARERDEYEFDKEGKPILDESGQPRKYNKIVLLAFDFGPQTRAELYPMAEAIVRHLMMRRLKFAVMCVTTLGAGYCEEIPTRLAREYGLAYGKDWANFAYKPGGIFVVKQMGANMPAGLGKDVKTVSCEKIPCMKGVEDAGNVALMVSITGYVGVVDLWVQYFASEKARPDFGHGCTSVSIPEAIDLLESGLIVGLFEGIAGAAAYNEFLDGIRKEGDPQVDPGARLHMTSQTVAHIMVVLFVLLGNVGVVMNMIRRRRRSGR